ncbi:MAG: hypothetical protein NZ765_06125, partial [Anaerolineae bacterium]|nr:hypothetical protein [Anaerolineae bacterium]
MPWWRDRYHDESDRDWWDEDEEDEGYGSAYGSYPYGWSTIMGMPYPIAIDIMRGKWPPGREESGFCDDGSTLDPGGDDPFWDPFGGGGDFFD